MKYEKVVMIAKINDLMQLQNSFASLTIESFWYKQLKMLSFNANKVSFCKNE